MGTARDDFTVVADSLLRDMEALPAFLQIPLWRSSASSPSFARLGCHLIPAAP